MAVYNGELYAGGMFNSAGGVPAANIARWNGSSWDSVGRGMDTAVRALAVYNGELYAGGDFNYADGIYTGHIAKWNGSNWSPVGAGMSNVVNALAVYNGKLYAGGHFGYADNLYVHNIACWNGTNWDSLGAGTAGTDPAVWSMCVYNNQLIVGGGFTKTGNQAHTFIAAWNDTTWSGIGTSVAAGGNFQRVYALDTFQSELYAGGSFDTIGIFPVPRIAKWNGSNWSAVGAGINQQASCFASDGTRLYTGGLFTDEGTRVAQWNGSNWSPMGNGMNGLVHSLVFYNGELFAAGYFTSADGNPAGFIARWGTGTGVPETESENPLRMFPNPANSTVYLQAEINENKTVIILLADLSGRILLMRPVNSLNGEIQASIDISTLAPGIYFIQLTDGETVFNSRLIKE